MTEAMGNKSSVPPKAPDTGSAREDEVLGAIAGQIWVYPGDRRSPADVDSPESSKEKKGLKMLTEGGKSSNKETTINSL